jgi:O-antigen/teichoic acid export membrane protein
VRLLRRNALGVYAVYAASIVSGLLVTPVVYHSIGKTAFGVWSLIGAVTIYLSVLDFGVGPAIVRFAAAARGRKDVDELNGFASAGLALYAAIGAITLPVGIGLAFAVPYMGHVPQRLVWDARAATLLIVLSLALRFPLGLFNNLLVAQQRWDLQNLGNFVSTALYAVLVVVLIPHFGGIVLLAALTLATGLVRLTLPLLWLKRELPDLRLARAHVTRARLRELTAFSSSNFLVHVSQKIVFSTDVIVVAVVLGSDPAAVYGVPAKLFALVFGIGTAVTTLMFPAFAELEGSGDTKGQLRLLLTGLRGGTALMLVLALPLLFIPDLLIHGWIGKGLHGSYAVMAILAGVALIHQPLYVLTQFLIARGRQRRIAIASIVTTGANLVLSFVLAWTVGIWGVAVSTLVTDVLMLLWVVPKMCAPAAGTTSRVLYGSMLRPVLPAFAVAAVVLCGLARAWSPSSLVELLPLGVLWIAAATLALWRFGLGPTERGQFRRQLAAGGRYASSTSVS